MNLLLIIPAYNEAASLPQVISSIRSETPAYDILVVNDGSTDDTAKLLHEMGQDFLDLPFNLGLAGAFQAGVMYACQNGYDAVMQFDGDGQHQAAYISRLVEKMQEGYDIVIGSRFLTVRKPINPRMVGSFLISFAMRITTHVAICDPTSGMRLFNRRMMEMFANDANYTPEPDTISYLLLCGAKIVEAQVEVSERKHGKSYLTFFKSFSYMLQMSISILFVQWFRRNELKARKEQT